MEILNILCLKSSNDDLGLTLARSSLLSGLSNGFMDLVEDFGAKVTKYS